MPQASTIAEEEKESIADPTLVPTASAWLRHVSLPLLFQVVGASDRAPPECNGGVGVAFLFGKGLQTLEDNGVPMSSRPREKMQ